MFCETLPTGGSWDLASGKGRRRYLQYQIEDDEVVLEVDESEFFKEGEEQLRRGGTEAENGKPQKLRRISDRIIQNSSDEVGLKLKATNVVTAAKIKSNKNSYDEL
jgi:hypothetical protein